MQRFEQGQQVTYRYEGQDIYSGKIQDIAETMLGIIRDGSGNYDAVMKRDVMDFSRGPREFKVGDRVRMIAEDPAHGAGEVCVGDIGVITRLNTGGYHECVVDFPAQKSWNADFADLEHEAPDVPEVEVSLDEAVANWQNVAQQIKELQAQVIQYERVMRRHGVKPV